MYLWALDIRDGSLKWTTPLTDQQLPGFVDLLLTQDYLLGLSNVWVNGWRSSLTLFDKISGKRQGIIDVKDGDRGKTPTEMGVIAKNLWLVKDNNIWVYGK